NLKPFWTSEIRAGWTDDRLHWDRPHPEIPTLYASSGALLPGSPAFYAYRNVERHFELNTTQSLSRGTHLWKAGGGALLRRIDGELPAGRDGRYLFLDFRDFGRGVALSVETAVARSSLPALQTPSYARTYRIDQFQSFVEDAWRATSRLFITAGMR